MTTATMEKLTLSDREFREISDLVYQHCGINLHDGKKELVRARLAKRLRSMRFTSFPEYMDYVSNDDSGAEFSAPVSYTHLTLPTN